MAKTTRAAKPKTTGLAHFTRRSAPAAPSEAPEPESAPVSAPSAAPARRAAAPRAPAAAARVAGRRKRGQGPTVALSAQVSRADWERLHQLAVAEGAS